MKFALSSRQATGMAASECFALGQKITEVGAALAYTDNFSRGLSQAPTLAIKHVGAGLRTAELAAGKLKFGLKGKVRTEVEKLEKDLGDYASDVRTKFIDWPPALTPKDIIAIQKTASALRQRATKIWGTLRLMCPDRRAPAATRKAKKAR